MNLRRWAVSLLAAAGLAVTLAAGASAQETDDTNLMQGDEWGEFSCVYSSIMETDDDEYFAVVNAYMSQLTEGQAYEEALDVIMYAVEACSVEHGWTPDEVEIAMTMGVAGTVADAIEGFLLDEGFSEGDIDEIIALVDIMSDDEVYAFAASDWRKDEDFKAGIAGYLADIGIDDVSDYAADCMVLIETYVIGMFQAEIWMDLQDG